MDGTNPITNGYSLLRTEYFDCACNSWDHAVRFQFDPTEDQLNCLEIWMDTSFSPTASLWRRIVLATKYIWNGRATEHTTGSWILKHEDYPRLRNFFLEFDMVAWKLKEKLKSKAGENESKQEDGLS